MNLCPTPMRIFVLCLIQSATVHAASSGAEALPRSKLYGLGVTWEVGVGERFFSIRIKLQFLLSG